MAMRDGWRAGWLLVASAAAACAPQGPSPQVPSVVQPAGAGDRAAFVVQAGDLLSFDVWNAPELTRDAPVGPDGRFQFPLIGEVQAAGRTLPQIETEMKARLRRHLVAPELSVALRELRSYRVYVTGEVLRPGAFDLTGPVSIVQAIALAGGFTPFAARSDILLHNPLREDGRRRFDYDAFLADPAGQDALLAPGDTLIVR